MKRFLVSTLLTAGTSLAVHLYRKQQSPIDFIQETADRFEQKKAALSDVKRQNDEVKARLAAFQAELKKAQPAINSIESAVDQFQFKIQPHLDAIDKRLDALGKPKSDQ